MFVTRSISELKKKHTRKKPDPVFELWGQVLKFQLN
jgi:hypothetical protein